MAIIPPTDRPRLPTDAVAPGWDYWPWWVGMDDEVVIDLANRLAPGEGITSVETELYRAPSWGETAYVEFADGIADAPVVDGTTVHQRIAGLQEGRTYELRVIFGDPPNRRVQPGVIKVAEGAPA
jgi:hypothetical protein